mmetsp:Transcript_3372/g.21036  ORF Transcript_3372/g.21036 Transcript_3372/m.21036 type:complete len:299 (-) Transcript_3372:3721-4617(-)
MGIGPRLCQDSHTAQGESPSFASSFLGVLPTFLPAKSEWTCLSFARLGAVLSSTSHTYARIHSAISTTFVHFSEPHLHPPERCWGDSNTTRHNTTPCHGDLSPPTHLRPSTDTSTRVDDVVVVTSDASSRHCILLVTILHRLVLLWKLGLASHARATLEDASQAALPWTKCRFDALLDSSVQLDVLETPLVASIGRESASHTRRGGVVGARQRNSLALCKSSPSIIVRKQPPAQTVVSQGRTDLQSMEVRPGEHQGVVHVAVWKPVDFLLVVLILVVVFYVIPLRIARHTRKNKPKSS